MAKMKLGPKGAALIKSFEGCKLEAYKDGGGVWTIGWGHTGPHIGPDIVWTQEEADSVFLSDVEKFEDCVEAAIEREVTQEQFDAMVSLAFNIGCKAFLGSTLVRLVNGGNVDAAAGQFVRWNKDNGQVIAGLTRRRLAEEQLFTEATA